MSTLSDDKRERERKDAQDTAGGRQALGVMQRQEKAQPGLEGNWPP